MACCLGLICMFFCCNDTATTEIYTYCHTLSLHDACPISIGVVQLSGPVGGVTDLQWRRPTTGNLVRVVTAEQATVSPLDLRRLAGGRNPQQTQRFLIGHTVFGQRMFVWFVIHRQCLDLLRCPTQRSEERRGGKGGGSRCRSR